MSDLQQWKIAQANQEPHCGYVKCCRTAGARVAHGVDTAIKAVVAAIDSFLQVSFSYRTSSHQRLSCDTRYGDGPP